MATEVAVEKVSSYSDYHRKYYQENKDKIWQKTKASDAYKAKYKRYYELHKQEVNRKHTERERAKREKKRAEATSPAGLKFDEPIKTEEILSV